MVDDDRDDLFLTKISFNKAHVPVDFVGLRDGESLFDYIKFHGIGSMDILLLDINIPVVSGYDILAKLREYKHFDEIKVIMFSTSNRLDERKKALAMGAKDFMVKPSSQREIQDFISDISEHLNIGDLAIAS
jgi:DNA-binding response OmpR family regulator